MTDAVKLANKFNGDKDFKKLCRNFFQMVRKASQPGARQNSSSIIIRNNKVFYTDKILLSTMHNLIGDCVYKLGPRLGSETEVQQLTWKIVCSEYSEDYEETTNKLIQSLLEHAQSEYSYVCGNQLFRFRSDTRCVAIGPVKIIMVSNPAQDIFDGTANPDWDLTIGPEYTFSASNVIQIQIPSTCWKVYVRASQANVKEEAEWLIDVAISFLRLSQFEHFSAVRGFFPEIGGKPEPMPCVMPEAESCYLLLTKNGISTGGMWVTPVYFIDDAIVAATQTSDFKEKAQAIFNPTKGSLAERFSQGLGWLTRGRQSEDRAERFLFFFTAIESLLSDARGVPVTQTIASNASVMLSNDTNTRAQITKEIKRLYADRSKLVHAGRRGVSGTAVNTAGTIAERIYMRVLEHVSLTDTFQSFQAGLGRAARGLPWPPAKDLGGTAAFDTVSDVDVQKFANFCIYIRGVFEHLRVLFELSDIADKGNMNGVAPVFFGDLNHILIEYVIQQICKVTDPEIQLAKQNHTVEFFANNADFSGEPGTPGAPEKLVRLKELQAAMEAFRQKLKPARDKLISHLDREAVLADADLGVAPTEDWNAFWTNLQEFVTILHECYVGTPLQINSVGMLSDTDSLLKALRFYSHFDAIVHGADKDLAKKCLQMVFGEG
jgi:hypothetical protein